MQKEERGGDELRGVGDKVALSPRRERSDKERGKVLGDEGKREGRGAAGVCGSRSVRQLRESAAPSLLRSPSGCV